MPVPGLTRSTIEAAHDPGSFARGERYRREGRVAELYEMKTPNGVAISGTVVGRMAYDVYVNVESARAGPRIESDCACPVGFDCKHAVALLLEYLERDPAAGGTAEGAAARPSAAGMPAAQHAPIRAAETYPARVHERLLFLLNVVAAPGGRRRLRVALAAAEARPDGGYGHAVAVSLRRVLDDYPPPYVLRANVDAVRRLMACAEILREDAIALDANAAAALAALLATGRCHWQSAAAPALRHGAPRRAAPVWRLGGDGRQDLDWGLEPPAELLLPLAPPWYLDLELAQCGCVETALPAEAAARLANAPRVAPEEVEPLARELAAACPEAPRPAPVEVVDVASAPPTTSLELRAGGGDAAARPQAARARLRFRYGDRCVEAREGGDLLRSLPDGRVERRARDRRAESAALARLRAAGLIDLPAASDIERAADLDLVPFEHDTAAGWVRFMTTVRAELEAEGWAVTIAPDFPYEVVRAEDWYADLSGAPPGDWFSVEIGVVVDGERLPLLPLLKEWLRGAQGARARLDALEAGTSVEVALPDGRRLILPGERVGAILATLVELYDADAALDAGRLELPRWRAMALESPDGLAWRGAEGLRAAAESLRAATGIERASVPAGFRATLRGYQRVGLDWLQFLSAHGLAGVLADDMGLGKTVQVLAHLLLEKEAGRADRPSLIVMPTSLLANWRREAEAFAPALRVMTWHGPGRRALLEGGGFDGCDIVLTTYTLLGRDEEILAAQPFHLAVLDEAQWIKNPHTQAARAARALNARHRLCLTGTPLENHLGEAWSLFDFLLPGLLGSERQFQRLFRVPIESQGDVDRSRALQRRLAPFLLRRRKDDVLAELPPKTEILRTVELEGAQRDLYESIRLAMHREVREAIAAAGLERSRIVVLDALLKLRQVCCDPRLVKLERAREVHDSAKLELLMGLLPELIEEGRRVLLFSQFTSMLALIETAVREAGIGYVKLTGQTRDRAEAVDRFQQRAVPLFLISLKAGGTGLNLTAADTVIHYDPWWNPAVEAQATDRAHRIGQHRPVFVYKLLTQGTVEERILALQAHKRALAEGLFGEGEGGRGRGGQGAWSPEDLEALFAPLE